MSNEGSAPAASSRRTGARKGRAKSRVKGATAGGKLRIGDNWNVITIIALSQNNPLKAIAEFVENSIDARASTISIVRGKERGEPYLKIVDDGEGVPRDSEGIPDFRYVATHIGDSLKRRLKEKGIEGIQGEFGIGLLSFWTVGERMRLSSAGADGKTYQMEMRKNEPGYTIFVKKALFAHGGTELLIRPLLPGLRQLSGERIQSYLASELRDRIRKSGVRIHILDRTSKKELEVQPRQFAGRLLHEIGSIPSARGEVYVELYLNSQGPENTVSLYRSGTRVVANLAEIDALNREPWTSGFLQGMIDAPFLQLTPGTRTGIVHDESFEDLREALEATGARLNEIIAQEKAAEDEQASRNILKSVQKAFKEAFLTLSPDDYQWFDLHKIQKAGPQGTAAGGGRHTGAQGDEDSGGAVSGGEMPAVLEQGAGEGPAEREFFDFPGPLYSAVISPSSVVMKVRTEKGLRCVARDKRRRPIDEGVEITWTIKEGGGALSSATGEIVTFIAPDEPGLTVLEAVARQADISVTAQSRITVSESLIEREPDAGDARGKGLPGYTFLRAPGELWRSRYDEKNNLIVINNGHRDYVYAAQKHARKLKYICRLFAKELVLANFPGFDSRELLERVIELSLYTEEHLK
ncbi:MAG TPA: ATP-binding protein [Spirochaetia bacterium]|nr:ATP-binding protein [Spirochaetia bacterium]